MAINNISTNNNQGINTQSINQRNTFDPNSKQELAPKGNLAGIPVSKANENLKPTNESIDRFGNTQNCYPNQMDKPMMRNYPQMESPTMKDSPNSMMKMNDMSKTTGADAADKTKNKGNEKLDKALEGLNSALEAINGLVKNQGELIGAIKDLVSQLTGAGKNDGAKPADPGQMKDSGQMKGMEGMQGSGGANQGGINEILNQLVGLLEKLLELLKSSKGGGQPDAGKGTDPAKGTDPSKGVGGQDKQIGEIIQALEKIIEQLKQLQGQGKDGGDVSKIQAQDTLAAKMSTMRV